MCIKQSDTFPLDHLVVENHRCSKHEHLCPSPPLPMTTRWSTVGWVGKLQANCGLARGAQVFRSWKRRAWPPIQHHLTQV